MADQRDATPRYSIARVYGEALRALRERPGLLIGAPLLWGVVSSSVAFGLIFPAIGFDPFDPAPDGPADVNWLGFALYYAVAMLIGIVIYLAMFRGIAQVLMGGDPRLGDLLRVGAGKALPALLLGVLTYFGVLAGMLLLVVPGLILLVRWSAAFQALANEPIGVLEAFGRSARLTRGSRWPTFGAMLVSLLLYAPVMAYALIFLPRQPTESAALFRPEIFIPYLLLSVVVGFAALAAMAAHYVELRRLEHARGEAHAN